MSSSFIPDHFDWRTDEDSFSDILRNHSDEWDQWGYEYVIIKLKDGREIPLEIYSYEEYTDDDYWCVWDYDLPDGVKNDDIIAWKYNKEEYD